MHLALVHDVACQIADAIATSWPALTFDRDTMLLGAALHDVGKVLHPDELTGPGHRHETAGEQLLRERGLADPVARIARTHGQWRTAPSPALEDLLVALADVVWKGARDPDLERLVAAAIAAPTGAQHWAIHATLDDLLTPIADAGERRVLQQASSP